MSEALRASILAVADALDAARAELGRLDGAAGDGDHGMTMSIAARNVRRRLATLPSGTSGAELVRAIAPAVGDVGGAIGPLYSAALAAVFDLVREANRRLAAHSISTADSQRISALFRDLDRVLGILPGEADALEPELLALLEARVAARAARLWARSDVLRDDLGARGILVEDTRDGQRWRRSGSST